MLAADAATCVASRLLMTAGAGPVEALTGIPASLLWYAGLGILFVVAQAAAVAAFAEAEYFGMRRAAALAA